MNDVIGPFKGPYSFLSNFAVSQVPMAHAPQLIAKTVEHAFQAEKMLDAANRDRVLAAPSPGAAKRLARSLPRRSDWESIKTDVMLWYVRAKFSNNPYLLNLLRATEQAYLIEINNWGDRCWGQVWEGGQLVGENRLGLILMQVRAELCK